MGDWQHQSVKGAACVVFVVLEILRSFLQGLHDFHMCVAAYLAQMPLGAEDRDRRRQAIRIFTRLGNDVGTPERLNRDASKEAVEHFLTTLVPVLQTDERYACYTKQ